MARKQKTAPIQKLLENPMAFYKEIASRIEKGGPLTPMPEFEPAVRFLQQELMQPEI